MVCVRITVLKKALHRDLAKEYGGGEIRACEVFKEGQSFVTGLRRPDGFCDWAWNDIFKGVLSVFTGGSFQRDGFRNWMNREGTILLCCSDGFRPVTFRIERMNTLDLIELPGVEHPAPREAYDSERWGEFSYAFPGLKAGGSYTVRLHFAEVYLDAAGKRRFGVDVNGKPFLQEFDIYAEAGGSFKAIVKETQAIADSQGSIKVDFIKGSADFPKLSAIEVLPSKGPDASPLIAINAGGPAIGPLSADRYFQGGNATQG